MSYNNNSKIMYQAIFNSYWQGPPYLHPSHNYMDVVDEGKKLIAQAITDKGVPTDPDATFKEMADNISQISGGENPSVKFSNFEYIREFGTYGYTDNLKTACCEDYLLYIKSVGDGVSLDKLFMSDDTFSNWTEKNLTEFETGAANLFVTVDPITGYIYIYSLYNNPNMIYSTDNGTTWSNSISITLEDCSGMDSYMCAKNNNLYIHYRADDSSGIASARIAHSDDFGATWNTIDITEGDSPTWYLIVFSDDSADVICSSIPADWSTQTETIKVITGTNVKKKAIDYSDPNMYKSYTVFLHAANGKACGTFNTQEIATFNSAENVIWFDINSMSYVGESSKIRECKNSLGMADYTSLGLVYPFGELSTDNTTMTVAIADIENVNSIHLSDVTLIPGNQSPGISNAWYLPGKSMLVCQEGAGFIKSIVTKG